MGSVNTPRFIFCMFMMVVLLAGQSCKTLAPNAQVTQADSITNKELSPGSKSSSEILQWVVVKASVHPNAEGEFSWDVDIRTGAEVWCERRCSEFRLEETDESGTRALKAIKNSILGNSKPGMLNVQKQIKGDRSKIAKVKLENIGMMGQSVTIEDVIDQAHPNFYAVPMLISKSAAGSKASLRGEFGGNFVEIRQVEPDVEAAVVKNTEPQPGFVMGSLVVEKNADGKELSVFNASKILYPWAGE